MATKKKAPVVEPVEDLEAEEAEVVVPPPEPSVDMDSPSDTISAAQHAALFGPRKAVSKPDISRLPDALDEDGKPLFKPGDKIVIERYAGILIGNPYLDTRTYKVLAIDMERGNIKLYDEFFQQYAGDNWMSGPKHGQVYKFAMGNIVNKKKRGRPRKNPIEAPKPVELGADGKPVKKKRGRPPGSKNRPKEEITAAKAEKSAVRAAKLAAKKRKGKGK
jgi:hypothetical protein